MIWHACFDCFEMVGSVTFHGFPNVKFAKKKTAQPHKCPAFYYFEMYRTIFLWISNHINRIWSDPVQSKFQHFWIGLIESSVCLVEFVSNRLLLLISRLLLAEWICRTFKILNVLNINLYWQIRLWWDIMYSLTIVPIHEGPLVQKHSSSMNILGWLSFGLNFIYFNQQINN